MATTAEMLTTIAENRPKIYKAGQDSEYNRVWDSIGTPSSSVSLFSGNAWNDETFKPKSLYKPTSAAQMFRHCQIRYGLYNNRDKFDFSNCTNADQMIAYSTLVKVGKLDLSKTTNSLGYFACDCTLLEHIEELVFPNIAVTSANAFRRCSRLVYIRTKGTFYRDLDFTASPLSADSMKSIISCLADYSTENTGVYTIGFNDTCWAALETDSSAPDGKTWREYVETTLGWLT